MSAQPRKGKQPMQQPLMPPMGMADFRDAEGNSMPNTSDEEDEEDEFPTQSAGHSSAAGSAISSKKSEESMETVDFGSAQATASEASVDFLALLNSQPDAEEKVLEKKSSYKQEAGYFTRKARQLLSKRQGKQRYNDDTYDLDLTYITPRIIAMSFPARGLEATYRNNVCDVAAMLTEKHGASFMIINVAEKSYPSDGLNNQVLDFGWPDHMAPPMDRLCGCVQAMDGWNRSDPSNVVVVHCKGGKGRTGVVIAAYMLQSKVFLDAERAMLHFAFKRFKGKDPTKIGITGQGQRRYVHYFKRVIEGKLAVRDRDLFLQNVTIEGVPDFDGHGGCRPLLRLYDFIQGSTQAELAFEWPTEGGRVPKVEWTKEDKKVVIPVNRMLTKGDVLARCYHKKKRGSDADGKKEKMFRLQFHTCELTEQQWSISFTKGGLDDAKQFPSDCTVTFNFCKDRSPPLKADDTMNWGAGLAAAYAKTDVDVAHAAAVMFDHARVIKVKGEDGDGAVGAAAVPGTPQPPPSRLSEARAVDMTQMTDEDRKKILEAVKSGKCSVDDAVMYVLKQEGLSDAVTSPNAMITNPFHAGEDENSPRASPVMPRKAGGSGSGKGDTKGASKKSGTSLVPPLSATHSRTPSSSSSAAVSPAPPGMSPNPFAATNDATTLLRGDATAGNKRPQHRRHSVEGLAPGPDATMVGNPFDTTAADAPATDGGDTVFNPFEDSTPQRSKPPRPPPPKSAPNSALSHRSESTEGVIRNKGPPTAAKTAHRRSQSLVVGAVLGRDGAADKSKGNPFGDTEHNPFEMPAAPASTGPTSTSGADDGGTAKSSGPPLKAFWAVAKEAVLNKGAAKPPLQAFWDTGASSKGTEDGSESAKSAPVSPPDPSAAPDDKGA
eukprot:m.738032 g.738032  ORF g.738032 m.738032 type:complete len:887 (+) comp23098_c1_seq85:181-2841(+)